MKKDETPNAYSLNLEMVNSTDQIVPASGREDRVVV